MNKWKCVECACTYLHAVNNSNESKEETAEQHGHNIYHHVIGWPCSEHHMLKWRSCVHHLCNTIQLTICKQIQGCSVSYWIHFKYAPELISGLTKCPGGACHQTQLGWAATRSAPHPKSSSYPRVKRRGKRYYLPTYRYIGWIGRHRLIGAHRWRRLGILWWRLVDWYRLVAGIVTWNNRDDV